MENVTMQELSVARSFLAGIIISGGVVGRWLKGWLEKVFDKQMKTFTDEFDKQTEAFTKDITEITKRLDKVDMNGTKNFLVRCLSDLERGEPMSEIEKERFSEQYDFYVEHDGNSYIKTKVERLRAEGKL